MVLSAVNKLQRMVRTRVNQFYAGHPETRPNRRILTNEMRQAARQFASLSSDELDSQYSNFLKAMMQDGRNRGRLIQTQKLHRSMDHNGIDPIASMTIQLNSLKARLVHENFIPAINTLVRSGKKNDFRRFIQTAVNLNLDSQYLVIGSEANSTELPDTLGHLISTIALKLVQAKKFTQLNGFLDLLDKEFGLLKSLNFDNQHDMDNFRFHRDCLINGGITRKLRWSLLAATGSCADLLNNCLAQVQRRTTGRNLKGSPILLLLRDIRSFINRDSFQVEDVCKKGAGKAEANIRFKQLLERIDSVKEKANTQQVQKLLSELSEAISEKIIIRPISTQQP